MTILYKPVLIESAEQAEALPVGTVAHRPDEVNEDYVLVASKVEDYGAWQRADLIDDLGWNAEMVGWTALVPIEAEEEWTPMVDGHAYVNGKKSEAHVRATVAEWPGAATGHRLVTPWEEA